MSDLLRFEQLEGRVAYLETQLLVVLRLLKEFIDRVNVVGTSSESKDSKTD